MDSPAAQLSLAPGGVVARTGEVTTEERMVTALAVWVGCALGLVSIMLAIYGVRQLLRMRRPADP